MEHHIARIDASNSSTSVAADAYNSDENFASLETTSQGSLSLSLKRHKSSSNPSSSEDIQMKKSRKISASRTAARQSADTKTDPVNTMDNDTGLKSLDQQSSDAMSTASSKQGAEASYNKDNLIHENKRLLNEIKLLKEQIQALAGPSTSTRTIESPTSEWITIGSRRPAGRHASSPTPTLDKPPTANRFQAFAEPNPLSKMFSKRYLRDISFQK